MMSFAAALFRKASSSMAAAFFSPAFSSTASWRISACSVEGTSQDDDGNGVPDECDVDCNDNGVMDRLDIIPYGTSFDCNFNDVPDECELLQFDCNDNGTHDACEIRSGRNRTVNSGVFPGRRRNSIDDRPCRRRDTPWCSVGS